LDKRGEDLVKIPEKALPSLLAVINGLFSNLEGSFSHLHAVREVNILFFTFCCHYLHLSDHLYNDGPESYFFVLTYIPLQCDSSVDGSYPMPLVFDRLPEVNEEGSQWTDCELTDAINLVHKNLEKLNSYLSVMVGVTVVYVALVIICFSRYDHVKIKIYHLKSTEFFYLHFFLYR